MYEYLLVINIICIKEILKNDYLLQATIKGSHDGAQAARMFGLSKDAPPSLAHHHIHVAGYHRLSFVRERERERERERDRERGREGKRERDKRREKESQKQRLFIINYLNLFCYYSRIFLLKCRRHCCCEWLQTLDLFSALTAPELGGIFILPKLL